MLLKSVFLAFKKNCQSFPNWGEVIWTKSKRTAGFFRENAPTKYGGGLSFSLGVVGWGKSKNLRGGAHPVCVLDD